MTQQEILTQLKSGKLSVDDASKLLTAMAPAKSNGKLSLKVSRKGAISLYGLQQMPVTLYVEQWERLLAFKGEIEAFATEWKGKEYKSEAAMERGGKKVPYTATITRKAA
ncbi:MAG: hypothetical protein ABIP48_18035 [Planctomycetota bacterium]